MDAALLHAEKMIKEGADILDVGGESTRPGHVQITDEEEIARVVPVIEKLKKKTIVYRLVPIMHQTACNVMFRDHICHFLVIF